jgi:hypothetical protein
MISVDSGKLITREGCENHTSEGMETKLRKSPQPTAPSPSFCLDAKGMTMHKKGSIDQHGSFLFSPPIRILYYTSVEWK